MKINDLNLVEWDGSFSIVLEMKKNRIVLLNLVNINGLKTCGRANLVCVDETNDIVWIAETPSIGREIGWFHNLNIENSKIIGWYGGSTLVEIDSANGKILKEEFVK